MTSKELDQLAARQKQKCDSCDDPQVKREKKGNHPTGINITKVPCMFSKKTNKVWVEGDKVCFLSKMKEFHTGEIVSLFEGGRAYVKLDKEIGSDTSEWMVVTVDDLLPWNIEEEGPKPAVDGEVVDEDAKADLDDLWTATNLLSECAEVLKNVVEGYFTYLSTEDLEEIEQQVKSITEFTNNLSRGEV